MEDAWERRIKPGFDVNDTLVHLNVPVPSSCRYYIRLSDRQKKLSDILCSSYEFTQGEIDSVFDPIVTKIITHLISEQIDGVSLRIAKKPKYIILSGGFGQSKYLLRKVEEMLKTKSSSSTLLGMNSSSWSAVSRGAVLQGLAGYLRSNQTIQVRSRVSRASYCTLQYETWDENVHDHRDKAWSDEEGGYVAVNQQVWFLKYGDVISEGNSSRFEFYSLHSVSHGVPSTHRVSFFHCRETVVPERLDESVKELCTIEWSDNSHSMTEIVENDLGQDHYAVCFDVEMVVRGAGLEFAILVDGKKVAAKNVKVQYTTPDSNPKTLKRPSGLTKVMPSTGGSQRKPQTKQGGRPSLAVRVKSEVAQSNKRMRVEKTTSARNKQPRKKAERWRSHTYEEEGASGSWGSWGA